MIYIYVTFAFCIFSWLALKYIVKVHPKHEEEVEETRSRIKKN